jgi:predicted enzyme related to lactoylglutathione lyase
VARDAESLSTFYARLFGWTVESNNALGYRTLSSGNGGIPGGVWPRGEEGHNLVQIFIEVDDIDSYLKRAVELGAKVLFPKQTLPDGDQMALAIDPAGLSFGLVTRHAKR